MDKCYFIFYFGKIDKVEENWDIDFLKKANPFVIPRNAHYY